MRPAVLFCHDRNNTTPQNSSSGDSHDRSKENTCTIKLVPTSAPSMMASADAVAIRPRPANEVAITAVAVLLCTSPVTPSPARTAVKRLLTLCDKTSRNFAP